MRSPAPDKIGHFDLHAILEQLDFGHLVVRVLVEVVLESCEDEQREDGHHYPNEPCVGEYEDLVEVSNDYGRSEQPWNVSLPSEASHLRRALIDEQFSLIAKVKRFKRAVDFLLQVLFRLRPKLHFLLRLILVSICCSKLPQLPDYS